MASKKKVGKSTKAGQPKKAAKTPAKRSAGKRATAKPATPKRTTAKRASAKSAGTKKLQRGSLALTSAVPGFTVADVEKSLAWYQDVLGFIVKERWVSGGKLQGAELVAGDVTFMIGQDDWKKGRDRAKGEGVRIYCSTNQDIDHLAAEIKAREGKLSQEPKSQSWGMRDLAIDDPDGYRITIAAESRRR
ncbi:MAG: VOC family protein [Acidobacteriota bacterium]